MSGRIARTSSYDRPARAIASVRMLWMNTSLTASSRRIASRPASVFRSQSTERLPRFSRRYTGPIPGVTGGVPTSRDVSPSAGSSLTTSAPRSASVAVQYGPKNTEVRSAMRMPSSRACRVMAASVEGVPMDAITGSHGSAGVRRIR